MIMGIDMSFENESTFWHVNISWVIAGLVAILVRNGSEPSAPLWVPMVGKVLWRTILVFWAGPLAGLSAQLAMPPRVEATLRPRSTTGLAVR